MIRRCVAVLLTLSMPVSFAAGASAEPSVRLAPHRAVYDLSLVGSRGMRAIESASGRIAFELSGNECSGYALKFRQVTVLRSAESGIRTSDLRTASFESGDGRSFRFRNDSVTGGASKTVDGVAERRPGPTLSIRLNTPRRQTVSASGETVFPNAQMKDIIAAAREGRSTLQMKLFDGSDDGRKVYETLAVIGREIKPGEGETLEEAARQDGLAQMSRWPIVLSYFGPGRADSVPTYTLSFDLYDNGVSRALKLDYGDFVLRGQLVRLDFLAEKSDCRR